MKIFKQRFRETEEMGLQQSRIVNYTPHVIRVMVEPAGEEGNLSDRNSPTATEIPSSGSARCATKLQRVGVDPVYGLPIFERILGAIEGLPSPQSGVTYVVSSMVLDKAKAEGRTDCMAPDTGPSAIREGGNVYAITQWIV